MFDDFKCPACNCDEYTIEDYKDGFDSDGGKQWWDCICTACHTEFFITRFYTCTGVEVSAR